VLAATISFALGVFNLLPVPALDGGRAAFIIAEIVRGKPVDPEKEALVHIAGFAALMALMLLVAFHDITRIVSGQGVF
jgi:regulator of sigma E protease